MPMPPAFILSAMLRGVPGEIEEPTPHSSGRNRAANLAGISSVDRGDANSGLSDRLLTRLPCQHLPPSSHQLLLRGVSGETGESTPHSSGRNGAANLASVGNVDRGDAKVGLRDRLLTGLPCQCLPPSFRWCYTPLPTFFLPALYSASRLHPADAIIVRQ